MPIVASSFTRAQPASSMVVSLDDVEEDPHNARRVFDKAKLQALADSIKAQGILQAPAARLLPSGKYRLIDGHRRCRAAKLAGLTQIRVDVVDLDDQAAAVAAATANLQREDLTPYEQARAFKAALDLGMQKKELCDQAGIVFNTLKARLQLLELPEAVAKRIGVDGFSIQHAQALLPLANHPKLIDAALTFTDDCIKSDDGLPDGTEMGSEVRRHLVEQKLARAKNYVDSVWDLEGLDRRLAKLEQVSLKNRHGTPTPIIVDVEGFDQAVAAEQEALKARKAKQAAQKAQGPASKKEVSVDAQAKRGLRNAQPQLMAAHVAKQDKWTDDLQMCLIQTYLHRAAMPARTKDQDLVLQACGLTDHEAGAVRDRESFNKVWKAKKSAVLRYISACMFFDNQDVTHEKVGDEYELTYRVEDPVAKLLTGKTHEATLEELKQRIKAEKAKKPAPAQKGAKKPKPGKGTPKTAAKAKGKAKKPGKVSPAVAKALATLEKAKPSKVVKGKQAALPSVAPVELDPSPSEVPAAEPVQVAS